MPKMILVSFALAILGIVGLLIAAGTTGGMAQMVGIGLVVLAWVLLIGYHGRRSERLARQGEDSPEEKTSMTTTHAVLPMFVISLVLSLLGIFGLVIAANASDGVAQIMGLGMMAVAWFLLVGYHARRSENLARQDTAH